MRRLLLAGAVLLGTGCAMPPMVHHGDFDWDVYDYGMAQFGTAGGGGDPAEEARLLAEEFARCDLEDREIPPGVRAHLGWLLLETGDAAGAREMFESEKAAYPESTVFVDRLLARMER